MAGHQRNCISPSVRVCNCMSYDLYSTQEGWGINILLIYMYPININGLTLLQVPYPIFSSVSD